MRFTYKENDYELAELTEPNKNETFDIIAILRVRYCIWVGTSLVEVDKNQYESISDNFEKFEMVNYFYSSDADDEELIEIAKEYIDRRDE